MIINSKVNLDIDDHGALFQVTQADPVKTARQLAVHLRATHVTINNHFHCVRKIKKLGKRMSHGLIEAMIINSKVDLEAGAHKILMVMVHCCKSLKPIQ